MCLPSEHVHVDFDAAGVAVVTIDNPPLNTLARPVREELLATLDSLAADEALRALVLTGQGDRAFSAGADLQEEEGLEGEALRAFMQEWERLYEAVAGFPVPVIAAVNGWALGGGFEVMLAADLRVAAETARMGAIALRIGLVNSIPRLVRLVGESRARDLVFTARHVDAAEAAAMGLVHRVVPAGMALAAARELAGQIAGLPPLAVRRAKALLGRVGDLTLAEAQALQLETFLELHPTPDHHRAVREFLARRGKAGSSGDGG